jgi:hypothetical protein
MNKIYALLKKRFYILDNLEVMMRTRAEDKGPEGFGRIVTEMLDRQSGTDEEMTKCLEMFDMYTEMDDYMMALMFCRNDFKPERLKWKSLEEIPEGVKERVIKNVRVYANEMLSQTSVKVNKKFYNNILKFMDELEGIDYEGA